MFDLDVLYVPFAKVVVVVVLTQVSRHVTFSKAWAAIHEKVPIDAQMTANVRIDDH